MSFLVSRLRGTAIPEEPQEAPPTPPPSDPSTSARTSGIIPLTLTSPPPTPSTAFTYAQRPIHSSSGTIRNHHHRHRSRSTSRTRSSLSTISTPPSFPTPFHLFKLHPLSNKNQVNALKFIDRIDSLLYLGHTSRTVLAALPPCMANAEAQAWFTRINRSEIHRPVTIEEFRQAVISDHVWAFEQARVMGRYSSQHRGGASGVGNGSAAKKDPYLESAEFKLHLAYIRDVVRLEEEVDRCEDRIEVLENENADLVEKGEGLKSAIMDSEIEAPSETLKIHKSGENPAMLEQLNDARARISVIEQEKRLLREDIEVLETKLEDGGKLRTQLSMAQFQLEDKDTKILELQGIITQLESSNSNLQAKILTAQNSTPPNERAEPCPETTATSLGNGKKELQRLKRHNQQILSDLHHKEIRVHDLEAQVHSYSYIQAQQNAQRNADLNPYSSVQLQSTIDRTTVTVLEEVIRQKDSTIASLHANLNNLTEEAINRTQRVFQAEQALLDAQLAARGKDAQIYVLEQKLQACNCGSAMLQIPEPPALPRVYSGETDSRSLFHDFGSVLTESPEHIPFPLPSQSEAAYFL